jgi:IMP dehydrogenase
VVRVKKRTGHSTFGVTDDGSSNGRLLGIVTSRDYRETKDNPNKRVRDFMTPFSSLIVGDLGISLSEANEIIWTNKLNCLPIIDREQKLQYFVFRKDYEAHQENPNELLDSNKKLIVGAGINTHDYRERVPALVEAGADVLCIDSSDGFTEWQRETIQLHQGNLPGKVKVGGGNIVDKKASCTWPKPGPDFIKVGIGGGSICITREQKGIGRGQATAMIEVAAARDKYFRKRASTSPLLRRRHRARLPHGAGPGHGRRLPDDGPLLRPHGRKPHPQAQNRQQLREGILGRRFQPGPQLAALRDGRRPKATSSLRRAWTATCPTPASSRTTST